VFVKICQNECPIALSVLVLIVSLSHILHVSIFGTTISHSNARINLAPMTGFEPVLRDSKSRVLAVERHRYLAGALGFEPRLHGSEPSVLTADTTPQWKPDYVNSTSIAGVACGTTGRDPDFCQRGANSGPI
jgi:hypothetical protein